MMAKSTGVIKSSSIVEAWYVRLNSRFVDLVSDYAGKETFLIEGDSLLLECWSDDRLDFDDGFQLLHAVYLVEDFLQNLRRRSCQFNIVFFKNHARLCIPCFAKHEAKYLLARSIVIAHLRSQERKDHSSGDLTEFTDIEDPEMKVYVNESGAYFIACCDGAMDGRLVHTSATRSSQSQARIIRDSNRKHFRAMIYQFMSIYGLDVALLNGLEWRDSKVMSFVLERKLAPKRYVEPLQREFEKIRDSNVQEVTVATGQPKSIEETAQYLRKSSVLQDYISPRLLIVLNSLTSIYSRDNACFSSAMILHSLFLSELPLSQRRVGAIKFDQGAEEAYDLFMHHFCDNAKGLIDRTEWARTDIKGSVGLVDLVDGRVLRSIAAAITENHDFSENLPSKIKRSFLAIERYLKDAVEDFPRPSRTPIKDFSTVGDNISTKHAEWTIMPFRHPQFDKYLSSIAINIRDSSDDADGNNGRIYRELTHWHNSKKPLFQKRIREVLDPIKKKRLDRSNQRFMAEMTDYAASLTNASGKVLSPKTIVVGSNNDIRKTKHNAAAKNSAKQSKGKSSGKAFLHENIALERAKKEKERNEADLLSWKKCVADIEKDPNIRARYLRAANFGKKNVGMLMPEVTLYKISCLVQIWASYCRAAKRGDGYHIAALILVLMEELANSKIQGPKGTSAILKKMAERIGFVLPPITIEEGPPLTFLFADQKSASLELGMKSQDFALLHVGAYFDRSMDSREDSRVEFKPDGWQIQVLDFLDKGSSLLVVAPTSSGKTFISFYAMEKVLQRGDDDVVVYVAPTKALVNQIAAEVQARFSKRYPPHSGKSLYAIHTRDYRVNDPTKCQVLVTVPHILQIMLLSPHNAEKWTPRIKTIIFDEVHSIGQSEDGVVWEQLLLMAPCQVIALSATVGNPTAFTDWPQNTQRAIGIELHMVEHNTRYSDLRKFMYSPSENPAEFEPLKPIPLLAPLGLENVSGFNYLHPVASLTNEKRGMPDDLALESKDCLMLYQAMKKYETSNFCLPEELSPVESVPKCNITKADILRWGEGLKGTLKIWMRDAESPFQSVIDEIGMEVNKTSAQYEENGQAKRPRNPKMSGNGLPEFDEIADTALTLISRLHDNDALPAILFNYDRAGCEQVAGEVLARLVKAEQNWRETNHAWKKKVAKFEAWTKMMESGQEQKKASSGKKSKQKGTDDKMSKQDRLRDESDSAIHGFADFDPQEPSPGFSFANYKCIENSEKKALIKTLRWREIDERLIDAFMRGIGVHHAGMNRKYRQAIEMYFRKGFLRVIIATGTLSLGINMPCKTVVFSGDSVYLTALNFRQAAGRAGRRGFDLLGNVVFHCVSLHKACRLLSSRLPDLNGHFPLTTTFVLRLLILLFDSNNAEYAVQAVNALLTQPRLYLGGESFRHQVLHHLRFSIEYLRSQRLIGPNGEPIDFCACISHLYFTENAAFSFHALLKGGYFSQLARKLKTNEHDTLRELMITLANLFGRRPCRPVDREIARTGSIVFLPSLPQSAASILAEHNQSILCTYEAYVRTFAEQHCHQDDNILPFTGTKVAPDSVSPDTSTSRHLSSPLLFHSLEPTKSRSHFHALSGHGDRFSSITDLCTSARSGIFLEKSVVPYLDTGSELKTPLNAYLLDFFSHGDKYALEVSNRIRRGDVWYLLNDFSLVLATLVASFEEYLKVGPGGEKIGDADMTELGGYGDQEDVQKDMAVPTAVEDGEMQSAPVPGKKAKKAEAEVVDSWDDAEMSDDDDVDGEGKLSDPDDQRIDSYGDNHENYYYENISEKVEDDEFGEAGGLINVMDMFRRCKEEFDEKFRKIFA